MLSLCTDPDDLEWSWNGVIALILRFSLNSIALLTDYVTVVEARLTISVKYCLWVPVFHFRRKLMYPAARSLCDSWASCYINTIASTAQSEHVSGAWAARKPLRSPTYFCNSRSPLRSRSATSRSALRSSPSFFCNAGSPLRSAPPIFSSLRSDNKVKTQN